MLIKICGLQTVATARAAVTAGADWLGFVFAPSRRQVTADQAAEMAGAVKGVQRVGVFVNHPLAELLAIARQAKLDIIQLHGDEPPEYRRQIPLPVMKAVRVGDPQLAADIADYPAEYILLDTYTAGQRGGSGEAFDWEAALNLRRRFRQPVFVAGGLDAENVQRCIEILQPDGVDVSGGVETAGIKDACKMRRFVAAVRNDMR